MRAKSAASSPNDKHLLYVVPNAINDVLGHLSASAYLLNRMNSVSDNLCTLIVQVNITNRSFQKSYLSFLKSGLTRSKKDCYIYKITKPKLMRITIG